MLNKRSIKKNNNLSTNKESLDINNSPLNKEFSNICNSLSNNTVYNASSNIEDNTSLNNICSDINTKEYIEEKTLTNSTQNITKESPGRVKNSTDRISEQFLRFCAWYAITGDTQIALDKSLYDIQMPLSALIDKYKSYNLPQPPDSQARKELLAIITDKLSKDQLADLIVKSAQEGKDNRIANMLLELYLQQERMQTIDEYRAAEIDQRFRWAIEEPDILVVLTSMLNLQSAPDMVSSLSFWREMGAKYGQEKIAEVKSLIEQALSKLQTVEYIDKRQLVETNSENVPVKRGPGRPKKVK